MYNCSIMFTGEGMRHLIAEVGIDHVVHIMAIPGLSDADRIKMLGGTAAKLLGIEG